MTSRLVATAGNGQTPGAGPALRSIACVALAVLGGACVEPAPVERGTLNIVGGEMNPGDPAVVYLSLGGAACTGSVIAKRWVMTAKHCVTDTSAGWIAVYEGANPNQGDGRTLADQGEIENVYLYDDGYSIEGVDIALLEASVDLDVDPIPYSRDASNPRVGDTAEAVGYGQSSDYDSPDGSKRRGSAEVISNDQNEIMTTAQICFGDSGGPLFDENGTVVGISSRITSDCSYAEDIFSNVAFFADWIAEHVPDEVDPVEPDPEDPVEPDPGDPGDPGDPDPGDPGDPAPDPPGDDEDGGGGGPAPDPGGGGGLGGEFGEECNDGDGCGSNACVQLPGGGGYCTQSCDASDPQCPYGFTCSSTGQGSFCFLEGGASGGGGSGGGGLAPGDGPGLQATCAATPGAPAPPWWLGLAVVVALSGWRGRRATRARRCRGTGRSSGP